MISRLKQLGKRTKIILVVILILLTAGLYFWLTRDGEDVVTQITQPNKKYYSRLTGEEVTKSQSDEPLLAVMIENSEEARPQYGLDGAGIVFETVTEAGITRYLALYHTDKPTEIGPVRSVRPAFVDWAMGFDTAIAHVGGSEQALNMIDERNGRSLNQFYNDEPYYRRNDRVAPHNMFLRVEEIIKLQKDKNLDKSSLSEIPFSDAQNEAEPNVTTINIKFSHPIFSSEFKYDPEKKLYMRSLAGAPHVDAASNNQISVKNLIVFKKDIQEGGLGKGSADLYVNGTSRSINWEQKDYKSRMKFYDDQNNEISLSRGDTWIAVVPTSGSITAQ